MSRLKPRPLIAVLAAALVGAGVSGCGAADRRGSTSTGSDVSAAEPSLRGDGDKDSTVDIDHDMGSNDTDGDTDGSHSAKYYEHGFYDYDDEYIRTSGHAASAVERRTIAAVVGRYYKVAGAEDGTTACSMIYGSLAKAIPEDYAQSSGPSYLRGATTCQAVMVRLFKHFHGELIAPVAVRSVRVERGQAIALLGSRTLVASVMSLVREAGRWKIDAPIGRPLQ